MTTRERPRGSSTANRKADTLKKKLEKKKNADESDESVKEIKYPEATPPKRRLPSARRNNNVISSDEEETEKSAQDNIGIPDDRTKNPRDSNPNDGRGKTTKMISAMKMEQPGSKGGGSKTSGLPRIPKKDSSGKTTSEEANIFDLFSAIPPFEKPSLQMKVPAKKPALETKGVGGGLKRPSASQQRASVGQASAAESASFISGQQWIMEYLRTNVFPEFGGLHFNQTLMDSMIKSGDFSYLKTVVGEKRKNYEESVEKAQASLDQFRASIGGLVQDAQLRWENAQRQMENLGHVIHEIEQTCYTDLDASSGEYGDADDAWSGSISRFSD